MSGDRDGHLRILTVLPDVPIPADTGLHLRMLLTLRLARALGCESRVLVFPTEEARDPAVLAPYCDAVVVGPSRVPYGEFSAATRIRDRVIFLANALARRRGRRYPFSVRYDAAGAADCVLREVRRAPTDVVILPIVFAHYAFVLEGTGAAVVIDAADVLSDLARQLARGSKSNPLRRAGLAINRISHASQERLALPRCREIWSTSAAEAAHFAAIAPATPVVVVPNALDGGVFTQLELPSAPRIGFIGTYSYGPNLWALRRLAERVLPAVRAQVPSTELVVAGAGLPAEDAARLASTPGIHVLGQVDNPVEFYRECRIVVLPITARGGVPLKLVEALARGRPVVGTPELVGDLPLTPGREIAVAADDDGLAASAIGLLRDDSRAVAMASAGRRAFERLFSFDAALAALKHSTVLTLRHEAPACADAEPVDAHSPEQGPPRMSGLLPGESS